MMRHLTLVLILLLGACANIERAALPRPELLPGSDWSRSAPPPGQAVNHRPWDRFLRRHVHPDSRGVNRLDYGQVSRADHVALQTYLSALQQVEPVKLNRDQQLAYWINLYNALTVNLVLENYPVASIRDITDGPFSFGPWDRELALVADRRLTLNDIEHRIIRPIYDEPRIHYALNCAAVGCPNLMARAWRAETLAADLAAAEHAYVNDPRGARYDPRGRLILSKIYIWFREDFGTTDKAIIARLQGVAEPPLKARFESTRRIGGYDYDWALNDTARRAR